jgi:hypothetical protein
MRIHAHRETALFAAGDADGVHVVDDSFVQRQRAHSPARSGQQFLLRRRREAEVSGCGTTPHSVLAGEL